ncbi:MAG TPA: hypothetical protein VGK73_30825 [Polyangiaceae bacterium]
MPKSELPNRADDIKRSEAVAASSPLAALLALGLLPDDATALARILPDAIAALRFVEEHWETLEAVLADATSHREDYFKCEREALEALRRLTAERGESLP